MLTLNIPARDRWQAVLLEALARNKLARWGRRVGKSRAMLLAAVTGHGSSEGESMPRWPGLAQGRDVVWLARDFSQASIWREEIRPRFAGVATLHNSPPYWAQIPGGGTLHLRSEKNVDSIRGLGKTLGGVVCDEAAHYDLEYAWLEVIRPTLADNKGWAIFASTTNSGWDGNTERRTPSYFNQLCERHRAGELGPDWDQCEVTTRQALHIDAEEIAQLYRDLGTAAPEELDVVLRTGGPGIWATEWRADLHVLPRLPEIPDWWTWYAGYDWGYYDDGWLGIAAVGDGRVIVAEEYHHQREHAELAGRHCGEVCARYPIAVVGADGEMWSRAVPKSKGVGPTIGEEWTRGFEAGWQDVMRRRPERERSHAPTITPAAHSAGARETRSQLLHRYLAWEERAGVPTTPALQFVGPNCPYAIGTIPYLPVDPLHPNTVDTHAADHAWDGLGYLLQVRPHGDERPPVGLPADRHPGLEQRYRRRLAAMGLLDEEPTPKRTRYRPKEMTRAE